jgi:hypothetical protein
MVFYIHHTTIQNLGSQDRREVQTYKNSLS